MRSIVVTGGSRGLGLAMARTLAADGLRVVAVARSEGATLGAAIAEARAAGKGEIRFAALDLADTEAIAPFVKQLRRDTGPVWGLVNNAGIGTDGILATMPDAAVERLVRLNTLSPMLLAKHVVRAMMADGGGGRIVNVASITAFTGYQGLSVYGATKASMVGFTRSLAREVGRLGITVNAVAPGFIDTELTSGLDGSQREQLVRRSALRRLAEPADVAEAVAFLLSDKARNITGATLTVDAGSTA